MSSYAALEAVLDRALAQASQGKGKERHAVDGEPFERQIICEVGRRVGLGYPLGQAVKKVYESQRLGGARGVAELLGAINYIAAAIVVMEEQAASDVDRVAMRVLGWMSEAENRVNPPKTDKA